MNVNIIESVVASQRVSQRVSQRGRLTWTRSSVPPIPLNAAKMAGATPAASLTSDPSACMRPRSVSSGSRSIHRVVSSTSLAPRDLGRRAAARGAEEDEEDEEDEEEETSPPPPPLPPPLIPTPPTPPILAPRTGATTEVTTPPLDMSRWCDGGT